MIVVGISAYYHESACALIRDGELVAAASEERFSRRKHDAAAPVRAFHYCLAEAGVDICDVEAIGYYENTRTKLERQLWAASHGGRPPFGALMRSGPDELRRHLGWDGPLLEFDHHLSHAASAFFFSGFDEAALMTLDGVGEWATGTLGRGAGSEIEILEQIDFPHSIGLLYSTITALLGFEVLSGEYKVMGLAPYGQPRFVDALRSLVRRSDGPHFELEMRYFDFVAGERMYSAELPELLGTPPRQPGAPIEQVHQDIARSVQVVLEELVLEKAAYVHRRTGATRLCMAGGVALNCVANGRIARDGPFEEVFVQPAATDAGGALGAAALAWVARAGASPRRQPMRHAHLGPAYSTVEVRALLATAGVSCLDFRENERGLLAAVVDRLLEGKVVAWFHGRMEFGARALGARSILADPRRVEMRERLNATVKKREAFRPFAPSVLAEHAEEHFALGHASPFMLETCRVVSPVAAPAITHVDGSARPQTVDRTVSPRFAALIDAFLERTGCPFLVNTSFNVKDEPIVCSPDDALRCMIDSDIDVLAIEDLVVDRAHLPDWLHRAHVRHHVENVRHDNALYTFL